MKISARLIRAAVAGLTVLATSCQTFSTQSEWRIQSDFVPAGSLHLGQVMTVGTRKDVIESPDLYKILRSEGILDADIGDGSVAVARIYCCGGVTRASSSEVANARGLYVPRPLRVEPGDIVEFRAGRPPANGDHGRLNTVTRIVGKNTEDSCWWDPRDERLWLRVLYCKWMPEQGWVKQGGLNPAWYKPPGAVHSG
jgi:hypothetical protein